MRARIRVVVFDCRGHAQVRPRKFVITCVDSNDFLTRLRWSTWGSATAFGRGVEWVNACIPSCVAGRFFHHNVQVVFWRVRQVYRHHRRLFRFTRLTVGHMTHVL